MAGCGEADADEFQHSIYPTDLPEGLATGGRGDSGPRPPDEPFAVVECGRVAPRSLDERSSRLQPGRKTTPTLCPMSPFNAAQRLPLTPPAVFPMIPCLHRPRTPQSGPQTR